MPPGLETPVAATDTRKEARSGSRRSIKESSKGPPPAPDVHSSLGDKLENARRTALQPFRRPPPEAPGPSGPTVSEAAEAAAFLDDDGTDEELQLAAAPSPGLARME